MTTIRPVALESVEVVTRVRRMRVHRINVDVDGMSLSDRLRFAREVAGMSQVSLTEATGLAPHVISDLERGIRKGATEARTVGLLARALGCSMDWLWWGQS